MVDAEPPRPDTVRWQTEPVPVVEGQGFLQVALVFGVIGLLGLVLRWTFRHNSRPHTRYGPEAPEASRRSSDASPASPASPSAFPTRTTSAGAAGGDRGADAAVKEPADDKRVEGADATAASRADDAGPLDEEHRRPGALAHVGHGGPVALDSAGHRDRPAATGRAIRPRAAVSVGPSGWRPSV